MESATIVLDVRSRRIAAGLTWYELAQRVGCSCPSGRLFDRGYPPGRSQTLVRVLVVADVVADSSDTAPARAGDKARCPIR